MSILFPSKGSRDSSSSSSSNSSSSSSYSLFTDNSCAVSTNDDDEMYQQMQTDLPTSPTMTHDMTAVNLYIDQFPCKVLICYDNQEKNCRDQLSKSKVESPS